MLLEINLLQDIALNKHALLNKEKGVEVHFSTNSYCGHLDDISRLKENRDNLLLLALSHEKATEGAKERCSNGGEVASKPKRKRRK
jgi:hypothetical protein